MKLKKNQKYVAVMVLSLMTHMSSFASHGQVFEIEEAPFGSSFSNSDANLSEMQDKHLEEVEQYIKEPPAVSWIEEAKTYRVFYYDPIYQVKEDITTLDGKIIAQKGQILNPLDNELSPKPCDLIFFDGSNQKHIEWAKNYPQAKWILVKGYPLDLEEKLDINVYFDQGGIYCKQFGIECVPAKVSVEGRRIVIQEIPCAE
jgi:conjugal transfer pilus assembly protein TraW